MAGTMYANIILPVSSDMIPCICVSTAAPAIAITMHEPPTFVSSPKPFKTKHTSRNAYQAVHAETPGAQHRTQTASYSNQGQRQQ